MIKKTVISATKIKQLLEGLAGGARLDASAVKNLAIIPQITKTLHVDGNRTDVYTETGSITTPYKTIVAAITVAIATTVIVIEPGTYNESLILKSGIYLRSRGDTSSYGVTITGKLTFSAGAGNVLLSGIYVYNTSGHALELIGTDAQKIRAYNCKFETNSASAHHAILATNTNAGSELFLNDCLVQILNSSGGARCIETIATSALKIGAKEATIRIIDDINNLAINITGTVSYWQTLDQIKGRIAVSSTASAIITLCSLYAAAQTILTTNSAESTILTNCLISTSVSPVVDGAGAFAYGSIAYGAAGSGFASTLNGGAGPDAGAIGTESSLNVIYDNAVSGLTATRVKIAIDELAAAQSAQLHDQNTDTGTIQSSFQIKKNGSGPKLIENSGGLIIAKADGTSLLTTRADKDSVTAGNLRFGASSFFSFHDDALGHCVLKWKTDDTGEVTFWVHTTVNYHETQAKVYKPYKQWVVDHWVYYNLQLRLINDSTSIVLQNTAEKEIASFSIDTFRQLKNGDCGITRKISVSVETTLTGASVTIANVAPQNSRVIASGFIVSELITSGDGAVSWSLAYNAGAATQAIAAAQAFTKNTKGQIFFNTNANTDIASAQVDHVITPNANTFSGGKVFTFCIHEDLVAFGNLA
jgi:hypothetical protein